MRDRDVTNEHLVLLMDQVKAGDAQAFGYIFNYYQPILKQIGAGNSSDIVKRAAEDLAQDTLKTVWESCHEFTHDNFHGWILLIHARIIINTIRIPYSRKIKLLGDINAILGAYNAVRLDNPETIAINEQIRQKLETAIEELPEQEREILRLRLQDKSFNEIRDELGITLGAATKAASDAKQTVLDKLKRFASWKRKK